jgi:hypothetical protein
MLDFWTDYFERARDRMTASIKPVSRELQIAQGASEQVSV